MHPRLTVHNGVFGATAGLDEVLTGCRRAGAARIGLTGDRLCADGWAAGRAAVTDSGLDLTHVVCGSGPLFPGLEDPGTWDASTADVVATLDAAAGLGARCVYGTTGPAMASTWEDAAAAFTAAVGPAARHARARGVPLLVESTNLLSSYIGFVHRLPDAVDVARAAGIGIVLDIQHCWTERGLADSIRQAIDLVGLVQLADYVPGRRELHRAVPGDGAIPLERILGDILGAGYAGLFDVELYGEPGVDPAETVARGIERVGALLDRLGA